MYKVVYLDQVEKDLKKVDKVTIRKILNRIENDKWLPEDYDL